jgi:hypothetical protein
MLHGFNDCEDIPPAHAYQVSRASSSRFPGMRMMSLDWHFEHLVVFFMYILRHRNLLITQTATAL